MTVDKDKLRQLAEAATPGHSSIAQGVAVGCPFCTDADAAERTNATPTDWRTQTLALLDELAAYQRRDAESHAQLTATRAALKEAVEIGNDILNEFHDNDPEAELEPDRTRLSELAKLAEEP